MTELARRLTLPAGLLSLLWLLPVSAFAQALPAITGTPAPDGGTTYSLSVQTLVLLTSLTFLPALLLMMTSFTRLVIVFSLLRHALGTQTSPPNQIIIGMALFLTFFIMSPSIERVYDEAYLPLSNATIGMDEAATRAAAPMKDFMLKQIREPDLNLFAELADIEAVEKPTDLPLKVILPAFVTSELKTAFQIGFIVFIPFLIIDMVVASVLMSMGMMMMSPVIVSLPFKIMLFVLVDGWTLLIGSLVQSFVL